MHGRFQGQLKIPGDRWADLQKIHTNGQAKPTKHVSKGNQNRQKYVFKELVRIEGAWGLGWVGLGSNGVLGVWGY